MKRMRFALSGALAALALFAAGTFAGCSSDGGSGGKIPVKVYLLNKPETAGADYGLWWWYDYETAGGKNVAVSENKGKWPVGADSLSASDENGSYVEIEYDSQHPRLGFLFVNKNSSEQSGNITVPLSEFKDTKTLFCLYDDMTKYYTDITKTYGIVSATITDAKATEISVKLYKTDSVSPADFTVKDCNGDKLSVESAEMSGDSGAVVTVSGGGVLKTPYTVEMSGKKVSAVFNNDLIDDIFGYDGDDLGITLDGSKATFKTWAPLATDVKLLLFADASSLSKEPADSKTMEFDGTTGVWSISVDDVTVYKYYQYAITANGKTNKVCDIWAKAASGDSVASQIVDINDSSVSSGWETSYVNPWSDETSKSYTKAVIYEMHIRDWSRAFAPSSTGKFEDITNALKDSGEFAEHLKDLGVTHVQILPMFDYAQTNSDNKYNWGYNPYHYNVPEGRYTNYSASKDGTDAVVQMRAMIKAFHDAGIAVNMDVVYNHTSGTDSGSLYDKTVPNYFYRQNASGTNSNGSGCGNELATQRKMVKKYVIDSLKHWMNDYHINGFRFDLMGLHETETMKEIYEELSKIDPNVMVYGEPWTGGTAAVENGANQAVASGRMGVGAFDDDFRDAIKGAEYMGFKQGQVQGTFNDEGIAAGLTGKSGTNNRNTTGNPALALHYVECHDNYTLFDKLAISYLNKTSFSGDLFTAIGAKGLEEVKAQDKLAAAYIFLAQGTPFINGGQEFLRTKQGDENSYESTDSINAIDLSFKEKYSDVYNTYKGLIALRKKNPEAFGSNEAAKAEKVSAGVTKYTTGDFCVYFNATDKAVAIGNASDYEKSVDVSSGTPTDGDVVAEVPKKSFVILKK